MLNPGTEDELAELVREGRPLSVIGSGTKRHHGDGEVVSTRKLDRITSYEPGDLVVSVQAGARLSDLQRSLAEHQQWLPLDPPFADATVGGILASGSSGPRRLGYGTARDLLLGLRVLGSDGIVTKSGGRVVKNVTGYDLHKLHIGARGSLGILVEAHFKVTPRPEVSCVIAYGCPDLATAHRFLLEVWGSALRPVALEALGGEIAAVARKLAPALPAGPALAAIGVEGSRVAFERHLRVLEAMRAAPTVLRDAEAEMFWWALRDLPERMRDTVTVRVGARPHDLPDLLAALELHAAATTIHVGNGIARLCLPTAPPVATWHQRAAGRGGYAVVESAPPKLDPLSLRIKHGWDPRGILNPGRVAP